MKGKLGPCSCSALTGPLAYPLFGWYLMFDVLRTFVGPSRSTNHKAPEGPFPKTPVNQQSPAEEAPKSRFRSRPVSRQASQLFDGPSIVTRLRNSSYGRFHQYLQQSGLQAQLQQGFQLPRVIVVGGRSAGKSSLLESITKCPIFPRHRDFCTKMPIELHMRNDPKATERKVSISYPGRKIVHLKAAHEILAEVNAVMQTVSGIDAKPIIIEICQVSIQPQCKPNVII